jgi:hypothetical protein
VFSTPQLILALSRNTFTATKENELKKKTFNKLNKKLCSVPQIKWKITLSSDFPTAFQNSQPKTTHDMETVKYLFDNLLVQRNSQKIRMFQPITLLLLNIATTDCLNTLLPLLQFQARLFLSRLQIEFNLLRYGAWAM